MAYSMFGCANNPDPEKRDEEGINGNGSRIEGIKRNATPPSVRLKKSIALFQARAVTALSSADGILVVFLPWSGFMLILRNRKKSRRGSP